MKEIVTFEPPETIVLNLKGELSPEIIEELFRQWAQIKPLDERVKVLVDQSELTEIPPKAREALRTGGANLNVSKLAIFGASTKLRIMGGLIVKMIPQVGKSKYVDTEEQARVWLEE